VEVDWMPCRAIYLLYLPMFSMHPIRFLTPGIGIDLVIGSEVEVEGGGRWMDV
jgi:hypothetical protein